MKSCVIALAFVAVVFSAPMVNEEDFSSAFETEMVQDETVSNLNNMVAELKKVAPAHLQGHVSHMAEHAVLIQEGKESAYAHDFAASKKAIETALKALNDDLDAGHRHDEAALRTSKDDNTKAINTVDSNNEASVKTVRGKACPTKRAEEAADEAKKKAKTDMDAIYNKKICGISTTWRDMDIEKDTPKMGSVLRNEWDKTRVTYVAAKSKYDASVKAHEDAVNANKASMAAFTTALDIQAAATVTACETAHSEYETLKKDVASNVVTRKQTYIAGLVIKCYVDHMTDNAAAKKCADSNRTASTTKFDINPPSLAACTSKAKNMDTYGPATWLPTADNCKEHPAPAPHKGVAPKWTEASGVHSSTDGKTVKKSANGKGYKTIASAFKVTGISGKSASSINSSGTGRTHIRMGLSTTSGTSGGVGTFQIFLSYSGNASARDSANGWHQFGKFTTDDRFEMKIVNKEMKVFKNGEELKTLGKVSDDKMYAKVSLYEGPDVDNGNGGKAAAELKDIQFYE